MPRVRTNFFARRRGESGEWNASNPSPISNTINTPTTRLLASSPPTPSTSSTLPGMSRSPPNRQALLLVCGLLLLLAGPSRSLPTPPRAPHLFLPRGGSSPPPPPLAPFSTPPLGSSAPPPHPVPLPPQPFTSDDLPPPTDPSVHPPPSNILPLLRLTYFLFFLSLGSLLPYLPVYYHSLSLPGAAIGRLGAINPFTTFLVSPLWGALADVTDKKGTIFLLNYVLSVVLRSLMPRFATRSTSALMANVLLMSVFNAPVKSLLDATCMALIPQGGYGRMRLWGQLG